MLGLITAITTGLTAFSATNIDDLAILMVFFSQVNATFRRRHIIVGQYLGFAALVIASLPGFFGGLIIPRTWIGLLGLIPIAIGLNRLLDPEEDTASAEAEMIQADSSPMNSLLNAQVYNVAAITLANGSDNIGVYAPLFASSSWWSLLVILSVFFLLLGVWCYAAYKLSRQPVIAHVLTHYGNVLVPFVLIALGVFIVLESRALSLVALVFSCLFLTTLGRMNQSSAEVVEE